MTYDRYRKIDINKIHGSVWGLLIPVFILLTAMPSSGPAVSYYMVDVSPLFHSARDERGKSLVETWDIVHASNSVPMRLSTWNTNTHKFHMHMCNIHILCRKMTRDDWSASRSQPTSPTSPTSSAFAEVGRDKKAAKAASPTTSNAGMCDYQVGTVMFVM